MKKMKNQECIIIEVKNEDGTRPCVCGSGIEWTQCPGNPELETPWMYCG